MMTQYDQAVLNGEDPANLYRLFWVIPPRKMEVIDQAARRVGGLSDRRDDRTHYPTIRLPAYPPIRGGPCCRERCNGIYGKNLRG